MIPEYIEKLNIINTSKNVIITDLRSGRKYTPEEYQQYLKKRKSKTGRTAWNSGKTWKKINGKHVWIDKNG